MAINPQHAWPFDRLIGGQEVNGGADSLPPDLRRCFDHLAGLAPEARDVD